MNARIISTAVVCLILASATWATEADRAPAAAAAERLSDAKGRPPIEKGMTAEQIVSLIGKPAHVRTMDAPEGKAEVWTYRRLLKEHVRQNAASVTMVPAFTGINGDGPVIGDTPQINYHLEHLRDYQVTALLMFDGKLVMARQWVEREHNIDQ